VTNLNKAHNISRPCSRWSECNLHCSSWNTCCPDMSDSWGNV